MLFSFHSVLCRTFCVLKLRRVCHLKVILLSLLMKKETLLLVENNSDILIIKSFLSLPTVSRNIMAIMFFCLHHITKLESLLRWITSSVFSVKFFFLLLAMVLCVKYTAGWKAMHGKYLTSDCYQVVKNYCVKLYRDFSLINIFSKGAIWWKRATEKIRGLQKMTKRLQVFNLLIERDTQ